MKRITTLFSTAILLILAASGFAKSKPSKSKPYIIRMHLAGARLEIDQKDFIRFDSKQNYYLIHSGNNWETAGATLFLCPASEMASYGYELKQLKNAKHASLPRLRSGFGVNIGESSKIVIAKLGRKPDHTSRNSQNPELIYNSRVPVRFTSRTGTKVRKMYDYQARYRFGNGKLQMIEYRVFDAEGWPRE